MDKNSIYVATYNEFAELWDWVRAYKPSLMFEFLFARNEKQFGRKKDELIKSQMNQYRNEWEAVAMGEQGPTMEIAVETLIHQGHTEEEAKSIAEQLHQNFNKTYNTVAKEIKVAIFTTDKRVRRVLKWQCPVEYVRDFLRYQWGIKTKWYHKIFWLGK